MKRRGLISVAAALLVLASLASPAGAAPWVSGRVTVTVTVGAKVDYEVVDRDHIDLRSNASWRLSAITPDGEVVVTGASTRGARERIALPDGTTSFSIAPQ